MLHGMPRNHLFHNLRTTNEFCSWPMLWRVMISFHMIIQFYLIHSQSISVNATIWRVRNLWPQYICYVSHKVSTLITKSSHWSVRCLNDEFFNFHIALDILGVYSIFCNYECWPFFGSELAYTI